MNPCPECQNADGSLNTDTFSEEGACTFGCGNIVPSGEDGICPSCREHSANHYECETCSVQYEDWSGMWEMYPEGQKARLA